MAGTLVKKVLLRIVEEDSGVEEKIDRIAARAEELKRLHPDLKVKVDTAEAGAKLAVLRQELKDTGREAEKTGGLLGRLKDIGLNLGKNVGAGGGIFAAGSGLLAMAGPLGAVTTAVGAFGAVAIPVFTKIHGAQTQLTAAQDQYNKVVQNEGIQLAAATSAKQRAQIEVTASKQKQQALDAEKQATAGLTGQQKQLMGTVSELGQRWGKLQNDMTPVVVTIADLGVKLVSGLMPALQGLATAGAGILGPFIEQLTAFTKTPFFTQFISTLEVVADQAGQILAPVLIQLLHVFAQLFIATAPSGVKILQVLLPLIVRLAGDIVPVIAVIAKVVAATLQWLQHTHLLMPVLAAAAIVILSMEMPITAVIIAITVLVAAGVELARNWGKIWHEIVHGLDIARHEIAHIFDVIRGAIHSAWSDAVNATHRAWSDMVNAVSGAAGKLISFVASLPGRILHAIGDLGRLLWQGGVNLVMGLVHGIESVAMAPVHAIGSIVHGIRDLLPFSPAKKGPLSGSGSPEIAGRKIGEMLASGIGASTPGVMARARQMAGAAGIGGGGFAGAGGGGTLRVEWAGNQAGDELMRWIRKNIRIYGGTGPGSVQRALGQT